MRYDPYYPPQDPLWPVFERFLFEKRGWQRQWNVLEDKKVWRPFWEAFCAGAAAESSERNMAAAGGKP